MAKRLASCQVFHLACVIGFGEIYARGFIQRHSIEVHMDKVESVDVDQPVLGPFSITVT